MMRCRCDTLLVEACGVADVQMSSSDKGMPFSATTVMPPARPDDGGVGLRLIVDCVPLCSGVNCGRCTCGGAGARLQNCDWYQYDTRITDGR